LNGVTLTLDEDNSIFTTDPVTLVFKAQVTQAQKNLVEKANAVLMTLNGNGKTYYAEIPAAGNTTSITISIAANGAITAGINGGNEAAVISADETGTIVSVKNGELTLTSATPAAAVTVANNSIAFEVTGSKAFAINGLNYAYSATVGDVAIVNNDFTLTQSQEQAAANKATITIPAAGRVAGQVYTVTINYLIVNGIKIGAYTFKFQMPN
jgi:glucose/arabinose dehydrogenase